MEKRADRERLILSSVAREVLVQIGHQHQTSIDFQFTLARFDFPSSFSGKVNITKTP